MRWAFFLCLALQGAAAHAAELIGTYLTWNSDPSRTMVVQWMSDGEDAPAAVEYRIKGTSGWMKAKADKVQKLYEGNQWVRSVELTGLAPDTDYSFRVGEKEGWFRTMPLNLDKTIKFVDGGDIFYSPAPKEIWREMNTHVAAFDPNFVILGGDIAYVEHKSVERKADRWAEFISKMSNDMVTKDGRSIPMVMVIGNHDVRQRENQDDNASEPEYFFQIFRFPKHYKAYYSLNFGEYLSLFLLDTGHASPIAGAQTEWLEKELLDQIGQTWKMASYHVAAYPGKPNQFDRELSTNARKSWSPLFSRYGVQCAFEHHNHVYKRTKPQGGVVYLGDGTWGTPPRDIIAPAPDNYIEKTAQKNAVLVIELSKTEAKIEAMDIKGERFDSLSLFPKAARSVQ